MFGINEMDAAQLGMMLADSGDEVKLIDVRSPMEVARGAIPGSENIPLHLLPMHIDRIPQDRKVVFYCQSGARSGQACAFLSAQGLANTYNLRGGIIAWLQQGRAVA